MLLHGNTPHKPCSQNIFEDIRQIVKLENIYKYYVWNPQGKIWTSRKSRSVIDRIAVANPAEGERYYLRFLLNHVPEPTSFENLLSVNGRRCETFKEAEKERGLLESDNSISKCLRDAVVFKMPSALRNLFATILVHLIQQMLECSGIHIMMTCRKILREYMKILLLLNFNAH
ncbi:hypothetical protein T459_19466 [Capsicum annuum]|uniref:Uncharacterized protein n=1 Tax=Capsicum annuum TaxID=4072 RepID=A0A2G2Z1X4_CAPAN|nr:hypothetical protein T459_19466 [Capsicum annuum]